MRLEELIAVGVKQGGGHKFMEQAVGVVSSFGEGFAVFVAGKLFSFGGDVGAARESARQAAAGPGVSRDSVRIRREVV